MENTLDGPVHNLVPPKCRCGTPLHPQYTQQEGSDRIAVTPVPQHIDPYTLPAGDWFDPLAWGATPEDVRVWQTGERQPAHDILARRGTRVASGACVPTFTPHPELLGEFSIAPRYAPFASEQDLRDAIERETAKAHLARVLLEDPTGDPPRIAIDMRPLMVAVQPGDTSFAAVERAILDRLFDEQRRGIPNFLPHLGMTFRSCYPSYPPKEPPPDGTL